MSTLAKWLAFTQVQIHKNLIEKTSAITELAIIATLGKRADVAEVE